MRFFEDLHFDYWIQQNKYLLFSLLEYKINGLVNIRKLIAIESLDQNSIRILRILREKMLLRHVAVVAKFLDDNPLKRYLKSGFGLFQTSSMLFNFI